MLASHVQVPEVHRKWRDFMKTNRAKSNVYDAEEQANALLDLAEHVRLCGYMRARQFDGASNVG
eukprot:SAG31_NODE_1239_length_9169_cov_18.922492_8_plen_64_part_00